MSDRSRLSAVLLCMSLGMFGAHRFYVRKTGTGVLYLLTFGIFGIGILVDLVMLLVGNFYDAAGKPVLVWAKAVDAEGKVLHYNV